ncbi:hypothetical protein [African swine fever virus]|uniref:Uncharacterized protein n=1 Tax=African swine fever virus TaxID=10497 RepID=A0A3G1EV71_ASF|nr:hypothetical protein F8221_gp187 [African swine fever virus]AOO54491.1 hypothetical protein AFSV47Ss_0186 [African swine fever virus]QID21315.1 hypothetical protein AFSV47Ss_0186 [African swine fever virus]QIM06828.1 hypothetical protein [African swine fever virus]QIM07063.1 hypothetical protein [African swine fever virus]QIM07298.1 hypothetical protein [African swine fever virus]
MSWSLLNVLTTALVPEMHAKQVLLCMASYTATGSISKFFRGMMVYTQRFSCANAFTHSVTLGGSAAPIMT